MPTIGNSLAAEKKIILPTHLFPDMAPISGDKQNFMLQPMYRQI